MEKEFIFFTLSKPAKEVAHHISGTLIKLTPSKAELLCCVFIYDGKPSSWKDGSIENTWLPGEFFPQKSAFEDVCSTYYKTDDAIFWHCKIPNANTQL